MEFFREVWVILSLNLKRKFLEIDMDYFFWDYFGEEEFSRLRFSNKVGIVDF